MDKYFRLKDGNIVAVYSKIETVLSRFPSRKLDSSDLGGDFRYFLCYVIPIRPRRPLAEQVLKLKVPRRPLAE